jgi:hypothetical protein
MRSRDAEKAAPAETGSGPLKSDRLGKAIDKTHSRWREQYKVHPAADVFPMMSDEELAKLGEDIKTNGLKHPIIFMDMDGRDLVLLDGRNRLEAIERAGMECWIDKHYLRGDPLAHIIGLNIRRRHLTPAQIADFLVALAKKETGSVDPVSKGGRGNRSLIKAKALEINRFLPKEAQVSEPTIKRSIAKARTSPVASAKAARPRRSQSEPLNSFAWSQASLPGTHQVDRRGRRQINLETLPAASSENATGKARILANRQ